ncbi:hypothetical protein [Aquimarina longa]|uniref:hypothetical protein n=1 Tax=Aquimarina longa TaxID=1080221 RepID=UPI000780A17B|nr:hypothetical protein [Aquimarina longa]
MEPSTTTHEKERKVRLFEERVFAQLEIKHSQFSFCVKTYRGYALLLRKWIKEFYKKGKNSCEVADLIRKSPLDINHIRQNKPLSIKEVILKNSRVRVS